ncbi:VOC family protein [Cellulomonas alba]|uniref:VOC family protein n=1 Tax=Cellulomonas alba TaxID=3053467 RepID=A0ABT7SFX0_9CELL|nr:VOC family protein [Cellulomonas alba]MDM7855086.1 VOC family protein [Cellulomonas alba]
MITGFHVLLPSDDPAADREFLRDRLGWPWVEDAASGDGWLIFGLPPAELGVHPGASGLLGQGATLFLMCDDLERTLADLARRGVEPEAPPREAGYGLVTSIALPSGATLGLYEPHHESPLTSGATVSDARRDAAPRLPTPTRHANIEVTLVSTVLECLDARELADFYERLLGWTRVSEDEDWAQLRPPAGGSGLSFSSDPRYRPPVWPATDDHQQMELHPDFLVDDLARGVEHALACGSRLADFQPQEHVRVLIDPAGHPFCFFDAAG